MFVYMLFSCRIERRDETTESDAGTDRLSEDQSQRRSLEQINKRSIVSQSTTQAEQARGQDMQNKHTASTRLGLGMSLSLNISLLSSSTSISHILISLLSDILDAGSGCKIYLNLLTIKA